MKGKYLKKAIKKIKFKISCYVSFLGENMTTKMKCYSRQQNYSNTWDNTCNFSLVSLPIFIISYLLQKQYKA